MQNLSDVGHLLYFLVWLELQWLTINTSTPQLLEFCCLGMS